MNTDSWEWFRYSEIFIIKKGKRLTKADMEDGQIPFIGATESNNGITNKIGNHKYIHSGNTISVSYNGSIAEAFYQSKPYWASDDINVLYPKFRLTQTIAIFITTLIFKEKYRFNYGRKWDKELMQKSKIKLPSNNHSIDIDWIEDYVENNIISALSETARSALKYQFINKPILNNKLNLNTSKWNYFLLSNLFKLEKCKCSNASELLNDGDEIAYIGAKKNENGIMRIVQKIEDLVTKGNCIVFIGDGQGSVGYCTYQPVDFIGSSTLTAGYNSYLNKYNAQFLITVLDLERYRYSFGRKYGHTVVKSAKIKLPITENGKLDWQFMENYIKSLPYSANL